MLEDTIDDVSTADICMMPPVDTQDSDGDSDNEDSPRDINHLSSGQLSADAEATITRANGTKVTVGSADDDDGLCDVSDVNVHVDSESDNNSQPDNHCRKLQHKQR